MTNRYLEKIAKEDYDYKNKSYTYHLSSNIGDDATIGAGVGAIGGAGIGGYLGNRAADVLSQSNKKVSKAALRGVGGAVGAVGGLLAGSVGGAIMGVPHGLYRGYSANSMKKEANCYLEKIAEFTRDSYADDLGYSHPGLTAGITGTMGALLGASVAHDVGANNAAGLAAGALIGGGIMGGIGALAQHQANKKISDVLSAQEAALSSDKERNLSPIYDQLKIDRQGNAEDGAIVGGIYGALGGGALGAIGAGVPGAVVGALAGGAGGALAFHGLANMGTDRQHREIDRIMQAREAYLRARA